MFITRTGFGTTIGFQIWSFGSRGNRVDNEFPICYPGHTKLLKGMRMSEFISVLFPVVNGIPFLWELDDFPAECPIEFWLCRDKTIFMVDGQHVLDIAIPGGNFTKFLQDENPEVWEAINSKWTTVTEKISLHPK